MKIKFVNLHDTYRLYINDLLIKEDNNLAILLEVLFDTFLRDILFTIETLDDDESWPNE